MTPEEQAQRDRLARKYNISFEKPVRAEQWPKKHAKLFKSIKSVGQVTLASYYPNIANEYTEPWKNDNVRRAKRLAALATQCERERRNESGWRLLLEPEVFARFSIEVACPDCRKRLWRSEVEVVVDDAAELASLEQRRNRREPCQCNPLARNEERLDDGLNHLFSDRAEEFVQHEAAVVADLPKKEAPDRVFGLQPTTALQKLADLVDGHSGPSHEHGGHSLRTGPFNEWAHSLMFPFLVYEAKSGKASDDAMQIQVQTAFSIRTLLQIQADLSSANGELEGCSAFPLVWFLCNKGELWKVSAGFVDSSQASHHYKIHELWQAPVTSQDHALQLLLIIDHIFDWARDWYRPSIKDQLKRITSANTASIAEDDCFSMLGDARNNVESWIQADLIAPFDEDEDTETDVADLAVPISFSRWASGPGTIRKASQICAQIFGLYITSKNIKLLLDAFSTKSKIHKFARALYRILKEDAWILDGNTLMAMEESWNSNHLEREPLAEDEDEFYVRITFCAYFNPQWEQIRELSYVAVSQPALQILINHCGLKKPPDLKLHMRHFVETERVIEFCKEIADSPMGLVTAIARPSITSYYLLNSSARADRVLNSGGFCKIVKRGFGNFYAFANTANKEDVHDFVSNIYSMHKIGKREVSEPFLRLSHSIEYDQYWNDKKSTWPNLELDVPNHSKLLLIAPNGIDKHESSRYGGCVFLAGDQENANLSAFRRTATIVRAAATFGPVYDVDWRSLKSGSLGKLNKSLHAEVMSKHHLLECVKWHNRWQRFLFNTAIEFGVEAPRYMDDRGLSINMDSGFTFNGRSVSTDDKGYPKDISSYSITPNGVKHEMPDDHQAGEPSTESLEIEGGNIPDGCRNNGRTSEPRREWSNRSVVDLADDGQACEVQMEGTSGGVVIDLTTEDGETRRLPCRSSGLRARPGKRQRNPSSSSQEGSVSSTPSKKKDFLPPERSVTATSTPRKRKGYPSQEGEMSPNVHTLRQFFDAGTPSSPPCHPSKKRSPNKPNSLDRYLASKVNGPGRELQYPDDRRFVILSQERQLEEGERMDFSLNWDVDLDDFPDQDVERVCKGLGLSRTDVAEMSGSEILRLMRTYR